MLIGEASPNQNPGNLREHQLSLRRKWRSVPAATEMFWRWFTHFNSPTKMELEITQLQGWRPSKSNDERCVSISLVNWKSFRDVWRFEWCSSHREIEHSIARNDKTNFKNRFTWSQSLLINPSHLLTGEEECYVICNCNAANIDVLALYLSEQLNYNLYYTLEK